MIDITVIEMLLMHYAAGALPASEGLMVAAHVTLNPQARRRLAQYEAMGGQLICDEAPAALTTDCLSVVLQRIDSTSPVTTPEHSAPPLQGFSEDDDTRHCLRLPEPVKSIICGHCVEKKLDWKPLARGIDTIELHVDTPNPCRARLRLMRLAPGMATPAHRHRGREITVVLDGAFSDETGQYARGDMVLIADPGMTHSPRAGADGCLCLTLTEYPLAFRGVFQRFLNAFLRF